MPDAVHTAYPHPVDKYYWKNEVDDEGLAVSMEMI